MVSLLLPLEGVDGRGPRSDGGHLSSVDPVATADELLGEAVPDGRVVHQIEAAHRAVVERRVGVTLGAERVSVPAREDVPPRGRVRPGADGTATVDGHLAVVVVIAFVFDVVVATATARLKDR